MVQYIICLKKTHWCGRSWVRTPISSYQNHHKMVQTAFLQMVVQPDCVKDLVVSGPIHRDMHLKDLLGSISRVGYCMAQEKDTVWLSICIRNGFQETGEGAVLHLSKVILYCENIWAKSNFPNRFLLRLLSIIFEFTLWNAYHQLYLYTSTDKATMDLLTLMTKIMRSA